MLLMKAPSEMESQTNSMLYAISSKVWNGKAWKTWPDFHFNALGSCCLPCFTGLLDLEGKSQQAACTHSSVRPAIPSAGCTFSGTEFAHRAEQRCWRRTSPTLSAHLVQKPVSFFPIHLSFSGDNKKPRRAVFITSELTEFASSHHHSTISSRSQSCTSVHAMGNCV